MRFPDKCRAGVGLPRSSFRNCGFTSIIGHEHACGMTAIWYSTATRNHCVAYALIFGGLFDVVNDNNIHRGLSGFQLESKLVLNGCK